MYGWAVIAGFAAFILQFCVLFPLKAGPDDGRLDIYWIDVEGGAATLIVTPAGESVLIDTGLPRQHHIDRIRDGITKIAGCQRLDHLIISHYDTDHYGGAAGLSREVPIVNVYDNGRFDGMRLSIGGSKNDAPRTAGGRLS
jgi:glyoxylase-like metal-dependent hydrolase (beta-lactamase superfamily II)